MDLSLFLRVAWRFRLLIGCGFFLATLLAIVTYASIQLGPGGLDVVPRGTETYQSVSTLFVTQRGFPWGRSVPSTGVPVDPAETPDPNQPKFADPARYASLAILYAQLANSDDVRRRMLRDGPLNGAFEAAAVPSPDGNGYTPFINMTATAASAAAASALAERSAEALRRYVTREQLANRIGNDERIEVPIVKQASAPELIAARKPTKSALVFIVVMMATFGLAFALENVRPVRSPRAAQDEDPSDGDPGGEPGETPPLEWVPSRRSA